MYASKILQSFTTIATIGRLFSRCCDCNDTNILTKPSATAWGGGMSARCTRTSWCWAADAVLWDRYHSSIVITVINAHLYVAVRVYCSSCVRRLAGNAGEQAVRDADKWNCYFCQPQEPNVCGLLSVRPDWRDRVIHLFRPPDIPQVSSWGNVCSAQIVGGGRLNPLSSLERLNFNPFVMVGRRTSDRKIASLTPGRCIAG